MPKSAYLGCYVQIAVRVRGVLSNDAALSINTDTNACAHPLGLSYGDLRALDRGENLPLATIGMFRGEGLDTGLGESAQLIFTQADAAGMWGYAGSQAPDTVYLGCTVTSSVVSLTRVGLFAAEAGDSALLRGPGGKLLVRPSPYLTLVPANLTPFFAPGTWQISAPGGTGVFAFDQPFRLPPPIRSTNIAPQRRRLQGS